MGVMICLRQGGLHSESLSASSSLLTFHVSVSVLFPFYLVPKLPQARSKRGNSLKVLPGIGRGVPLGGGSSPGAGRGSSSAGVGGRGAPLSTGVASPGVGRGAGRGNLLPGGQTPGQAVVVKASPARRNKCPLATKSSDITRGVTFYNDRYVNIAKNGKILNIYPV